MRTGLALVRVVLGRERRDGRIRSLALVVFTSVALFAVDAPSEAQGQITFRYFYDDAGQLQKVVDSTGVVLEYVYDAVGNILEIRRTAAPPGALTIFSFTPTQGGPLTPVTIRGQEFAGSPAGNIVRFNGVVAAVLSATTDTLVASVPIGATTGPVSVTIGGNAAASATSFTVASVPVITSITPAAIDVSHPPATVQITGANLGGAAFGFLPALQPPAVAIGVATVNADGTSATLPVTAAGGARGRFTLLATNVAGSSNSFPSGGNTVWVFSINDDTDTDGDRFPDPLEALLGSDPLDSDSVPVIRYATETDTLTVALLNRTNPGPSTPVIREQVSLTVSLVNATAPPRPPTSTMGEIESLTVSLVNGLTPPPSATQVREADSSTFALVNGGNLLPPAAVHEVDSPTFSLLNGAPQAENRLPAVEPTAPALQVALDEVVDARHSRVRAFWSGLLRLPVRGASFLTGRNRLGLADPFTCTHEDRFDDRPVFFQPNVSVLSVVECPNKPGQKE